MKPLSLLLALTVSVAAGGEFSILDHGATPDGLCTDQIQATIDACAQSGGGTVVVPTGTFLTGSLFLRQGVGLRLDEGAVLKGSDHIEDYPKRPTRIEGHTEPWRMALLNAADMTAVRISGKGTLDGDGEVFWKAFWQRREENPECTNLEVERPRLLFLDTCTDVKIEGIRLRNSGFWNLHLYRCQQVTIDGLDIHAPGAGDPVRAPSSDGIDIDSCQRVLVRNTRIATDDDCIAIKGSKGPTAGDDPDSPPAENIFIEDCDFARGHGVVTLGSEATRVRNVYVRRCTVGPGNSLVRLKLRPDTPQLYENLVYEDIELSGDTGSIFKVRPWSQFFDLQGHEPPASVVSNLVLRNIRGSYGKLGSLTGNEGDTIRNVVLENVDLELSSTGFRSSRIQNAISTGVVINGKSWRFPRTGPRPRIVVPAGR
ncbi:glycoside hydrolase family 28 protein [Haloferula sargassicola]|uniref:Exo-poly-alpha-D-galacturonosidase n=1 Tax=Haloferula sargassicola TaxID=490096 RepID=A0ABP9UUH2_9BACT